jgi:glycine/serine hydroxymethyltransferase
MKEAEMKEIAGCIATCLKAAKPAPAPTGGLSKVHCEIEDGILQTIQQKVGELLSHFPLYPEIVIPS